MFVRATVLLVLAFAPLTKNVAPKLPTPTPVAPQVTVPNAAAATVGTLSSRDALAARVGVAPAALMSATTLSVTRPGAGQTYFSAELAFWVRPHVDQVTFAAVPLGGPDAVRMGAWVTFPARANQRFVVECATSRGAWTQITWVFDGQWRELARARHVDTVRPATIVEAQEDRPLHVQLQPDTGRDVPVGSVGACQIVPLS
jgi:hypothetical protein